MIIDLINVQALGWCIILENIQLLFRQNDFKGSFYAVAIFRAYRTVYTYRLYTVYRY